MKTLESQRKSENLVNETFENLTKNKLEENIELDRNNFKTF